MSPQSRTVFCDEDKYKVRDKRYSISLKCRTCKRKIMSGGNKSLRNLQTFINDEIDNHYTICDSPDIVQEQKFHAAEIDYTYNEQPVEQTRTGATTYGDISGASIADTAFTNGQKYLVLVRASCSASEATTSYGIQTLHGSTAFAQSEFVYEMSGDATVQLPYVWFTVWTAVASEGIKLQFKTTNSGNTVQADTISMLAMRLDADLTEGTDWEFNDNTADTSFTTSWSTTNNASITIASGDHATDDRHLIMAVSRIDDGTASANHESRLERSGEAAENTDLVSQEGENPGTDFQNHFMTRTLTLGASNNTFTQSSRIDSGSSGTRKHSAVFSLNLDKFSVSDHAYTAATTTLSNTNWATLSQTLSFDLSGEAASRNSFVMGYFIGDYQFSGTKANSIQGRLQIANVDQPTGQTAYTTGVRNWDATDQHYFCVFTVQEPLTAASHTVDIDSHSDTGTGPVSEDRVITAFTFELAGAAPAPTFTPRNTGWF